MSASITHSTLDTLIIGAGAAGLMCAIKSGERQKSVTVIDHANKIGKKILMSGGGRCNFTNLYVNPDAYLSHNPHFCKSALARYTPFDFIDLVKKHRISYYEKTKGQLFCVNKSSDIVDMLKKECDTNRVNIHLKTTVESIKPLENGQFVVQTNHHQYQCRQLVIATGGLSIPTMGASPFAYQIAEQFGIKVWPLRAGLVPLTLDVTEKSIFSELSGISIAAKVHNQSISFDEDVLFTHRGLSGPAILQLSSYWKPGAPISINCLPNQSLSNEIATLCMSAPNKKLQTILNDMLPKRLVSALIHESLLNKTLKQLSTSDHKTIEHAIQSLTIKPNGTEGYRTAEVTLGGIDCDAMCSKTMMVKAVPHLHFIGEALDVTGWLGGYNFQWAWASGFAAAQA